jgi:hypothetical protein
MMAATRQRVVVWIVLAVAWSLIINCVASRAVLLVFQAVQLRTTYTGGEEYGLIGMLACARQAAFVGRNAGAACFLIAFACFAMSPAMLLMRRGVWRFIALGVGFGPQLIWLSLPTTWSTRVCWTLPVYGWVPVALTCSTVAISLNFFPYRRMTLIFINPLVLWLPSGLLGAIIGFDGYVLIAWATEPMFRESAIGLPLKIVEGLVLFPVCVCAGALSSVNFFGRLQRRIAPSAWPSFTAKPERETEK